MPLDNSRAEVVVGATGGSVSGQSVHVSSYSVAPTSNSSLFVSGAFQVAWVNRLGVTRW